MYGYMHAELASKKLMEERIIKQKIEEAKRIKFLKEVGVEMKEMKSFDYDSIDELEGNYIDDQKLSARPR